MDPSCKIVSEASQKFAAKIGPLMFGPSSNVIASCYSLGSVLALLHVGASGSTAELLREALSLPSNEAATRESFRASFELINKNDGSFTLEAANRLFVQKQFAISSYFLETASQTFLAAAENVNFGDSKTASDIINQWEDAKTRSKIRQIVSPDALNGQTRLVLVNAIYFKGTWQVEFKKENTKPENFHVTEKTTVKVPMMKLTSTFKIADLSKDLKARVLMMPYKGGRLSMWIFLPLTAKDFGTMAKNFHVFDFNASDSRFSWHDVVNVYLPSFKFETTHHLNGPLQSIGLKELFVAGRANFSKLSEAEKLSKQLYVDMVIQKAFVEVNEEGTEAVAVTAVVTKGRCSKPPPPPIPTEFRCDRPFMFAIRDNLTGFVLFTGQVADP